MKQSELIDRMITAIKQILSDNKIIEAIRKTKKRRIHLLFSKDWKQTYDLTPNGLFWQNCENEFEGYVVENLQFVKAAKWFLNNSITPENLETKIWEQIKKLN